MNSSKPRLHHYVPQFHLAYFADEASRLWAYDKCARIRPNPKQIPFARLAAEAELYDDDDPNEALDGVEEWLAAHVDGPAAAVVRKVTRHDDISPTEREALGRYVMSPDLRSPTTRDFIMSLAQQGIVAEFDRRMSDTAAVRQAILAQSGVEVSEDEIRELSQLYHPVVSKGMWLKFMQRNIVEALPRLLSKGWTLFHADEGCEFLISDRGIQKHRGGWQNPVIGGPGWWTNADAWIMPLTPRIALAMAPGLLNQEKLAQRAYIDLYNRSVVEHATEFVFAASEDELRRAIDAV